MRSTKFWVFICAVGLALPTAGYSQLLLYDGFSSDDYAAGDAIDVSYGGAVNGYEVGGAWNNNEFAEGGLEHDSALLTTPGVRVVRTTDDMEGFLDVSDGGVFDAAGLLGTNGYIGGEEISGTLYYSFLGRELDENGDSWGGFNLWNIESGDEHFGLGNGGGPNDYVTYHHDSGEPPIGDPPTPIDGEVHLFVVRADYDGEEGAKDFYTAWLDPDPTLGEDEQSEDIRSATVGTRDEDTAGFLSFRMRGDNTLGQWEFDEIRFGVTWEDVTPTSGGGDLLAPLDNGTITDPIERVNYVHDVLGTWVGDSNLDGEFNSADLVAIFQAGQYEDGIAGNSSWATGDWSGDKDFGSSDLVVAFQDGGFEAGPRGAVSSVPEPSAVVLILIGCGCLLRFRRK